MMSILLAPDDADASTLAAVLAFIDSAGDSAPDSVDPSSTASQLPEKAAAVKYTTEFQRKKRAEIAALREQAEELEERLAHLQHARATPSRADDGSGASLPANAEALMMWRETARDEHGKRLRAEQLNRKLKEVAKHYLQLGDDVLGVLKKRRRPEVGASSSDRRRLRATYGLDTIMCYLLCAGRLSCPPGHSRAASLPDTAGEHQHATDGCNAARNVALTRRVP